MTSSSSSSSSSADTTYNNKLNSRAIRKKNGSSSTRPSNLCPRCLREYLVSPNLKSLLPSTPPPPPPPPPQPQVGMCENELVDVRGAAEVKLDPRECLEGDSSSSSSCDDQEMNLAATTTSSTISQQKKAFNLEDGDDGGCCINVDFDEEEDASQPFKPSIKIRKMDDDSIHINTIVMKEVSLTSTLFGVLEEEKLDIVFEDQYRTETKVAHNIQVRVQPGYDVDALEMKLRLWGQCTM